MCKVPARNMACRSHHAVLYGQPTGPSYWSGSSPSLSCDKHARSYIACEDPRPHARNMCAACFCPCISLSLATPLGRSLYQTSEFPPASEYPTKLPTHFRSLLAMSATSLVLNYAPRTDFRSARQDVERKRRSVTRRTALSFRTTKQNVAF